MPPVKKSRKYTSNVQLAHKAYDKATSRLREAHKEEFIALYNTERFRLGLQFVGWGNNVTVD